MSLAPFHICLISAAIALACLLGGWGLWHYQETRSLTDLLTGLGSCLGGGVLTAYLVWFVRKIRNKTYLKG